jgi:uncharacterized protein DUF6378
MPKYLIQPPAQSLWMSRYIDAADMDGALNQVHALGYPDHTRVLPTSGDNGPTTAPPFPGEEKCNHPIAGEGPCHLCESAHVHNSPADATEALLAERGKTHGKFEDHAHYAQELKRIISWEAHKFTDEQREALAMIAHKIGRIMAGDPNFADHWDDIAGYARLVSRALSPQA